MASQSLSKHRRRKPAAAPSVRRLDLVTYTVWTFGQAGYEPTQREATVIWVRHGQARLFTRHDGGKVFTLPLEKVRHA